MLAHVPKEFFGIEYRAVFLAYLHASPQLPQVLVVPVSRVGGKVHLDVERRVVFLHEDTAHECLFRRLCAVVHAPLFGNELVLYYSGVGN